MHLCPTCERYLTNGETMRAALLDAVDSDRAMRRQNPYEPELRGVRGWAVANRAKPNAEPWAHVGLNDLRALLAVGDW